MKIDSARMCAGEKTHHLIMSLHVATINNDVGRFVEVAYSFAQHMRPFCFIEEFEELQNNFFLFIKLFFAGETFGVACMKYMRTVCKLNYDKFSHPENSMR